MIPQCIDIGVGILPWSPLARGLLARPPTEREVTARGASDQLTPQWYSGSSDEVIDVVGGISDSRGISRAQVAISWLLSKSVVTAPIVGATNALQVEEAAGAVGIELTEEEIRRLEAPYTARDIAGH